MVDSPKHVRPVASVAVALIVEVPADEPVYVRLYGEELSVRLLEGVTELPDSLLKTTLLTDVPEGLGTTTAARFTVSPTSILLLIGVRERPQVG